MPIQKITSGIIQDGAVVAAEIADGTITGAKLTANTLANSVFQTGSVENYMNAAGLGFGMRNRIINGAMVIDQRNAGASVSVTTGNDGYPVDRFYIGNRTGSGVFLGQQATASNPVGYKSVLGVTTTTAQASLTATQWSAVRQSIEGFNVSDLGWGTANAATVTLSFWVRSSLTGTFGGSFVNASFNRSYPFSYSISSANTWTQISITIAGDTTGTWATDNTAGIHIFFGLGVGSTYSGTAGAWDGTAYYSATGATSVVGTNGATFYITGVQLEKGSTATSFDYRPYGTELALCQRYYWQSTSRPNGTQFYEFSGVIISTSGARINFNLPTAMRTQPTVAINPVYNTGSSWNINLTGIDNYALSQAPTILAGDGAASGGGNMIAILFTTASTLSSANYGRAAVAYSTTGTATNNFQFSAEL